MEVIKEATLFSFRPDLVVVIYEGRLIFAVEIKNPGQTVQNVEASEIAGGQCLDYLKGMKQQGLDQPFVLLSTYNSTSIVRLPGWNQPTQIFWQRELRMSETSHKRDTLHV